MSELVFVHAWASEAVVDECKGAPTTEICDHVYRWVDGELEYILGYDIVDHVDGNILDIPSQPCTVVTEEGGEIKALLLTYISPTTYRHCQFIVSLDQDDGMERLIRHTKECCL